MFFEAMNWKNIVAEWLDCIKKREKEFLIPRDKKKKKKKTNKNTWILHATKIKHKAKRK